MGSVAAKSKRGAEGSLPTRPEACQTLPRQATDSATSQGSPTIASSDFENESEKHEQLLDLIHRASAKTNLANLKPNDRDARGMSGFQTEVWLESEA